MPGTEKIDVFKQHKDEYLARRKPVLVDVRKANYLTIGGKGAPGSAEFSAKIMSLYSVAYTVKMTRKFAGEQDYTIGKLETQYTLPAGGTYERTPTDQWGWKMLIRTPDFVKRAELRKALSVLQKRGTAAGATDVQLETIAGCQAVQMLHVGPYERIAESCSLMDEFARNSGLVFCGPHHEIYLSDPRRVAPEKLKTILREPVRRGRKA